MSWRIATRHVSTYRYASPVHRLVQRGPDDAGRLPPPGRPREPRRRSGRSTPPLRYVDYWSTTVYAFDVHEPHDEPRRDRHVGRRDGAARSRSPSTRRGRSSTTTRCRTATPSCSLPTAYAPSDPLLRELAGQFAALGSPADAVERGERVGPLRDALRAGNHPGLDVGDRGVAAGKRASARTSRTSPWCSFASSASPPVTSRATSTPRPTRRSDDTVDGASHAWIEAWLGRWQADRPDERRARRRAPRHRARAATTPTSRPLHGLYHGGALEDLDVVVELTRVA